MASIFVSIACLLDSDIVNTIEDCFLKAENAKRIRIGVCYQLDYDKKDVLKKYENDDRVRIIRMNWKDAKGPMLPRSKILNLIKDEEYFLQIDCHTRFFKNWDTKIIAEYKKCLNQSNKPIISYYPINIKNMENSTYLSRIGVISCFREISKNAIKTHGSLQSLPKIPKKSYGIMAAMMFMKCEDIKKIPIDPNMPFGLHSEEQFLHSVRFWTHGYDFFCPTQHILAMEYITNKDRMDDKYKSYLADKYNKYSKKSWERAKYLLNLDSYKNKEDNINFWGIGFERSIEEYYEFVKIYDKLIEIFPKNNLKKVEIINPKKKIAIVSLQTENISWFADKCYQNIKGYAKEKDYTAYLYYKSLVPEVKEGESSLVPWSKIKAVMNHIKDHEVIMWIDSDAIFVNNKIKIEDLVNKYNKSFLCCKDPGRWYMNSGVMIFKNNQWSNKFLEDLWELEHIPYGKGCEQAQICNLLKGKYKDDKNWVISEEAEFNCYPTNYKEGVFVIHYMGREPKKTIVEEVNKWNKKLNY